MVRVMVVNLIPYFVSDSVPFCAGNLLAPKDILPDRSASSDKPTPLVTAFQKILTSSLKAVSLGENFLSIDSVITLFSG